MAPLASSRTGPLSASYVSVSNPSGNTSGLSPLHTLIIILSILVVLACAWAVYQFVQYRRESSVDAQEEVDACASDVASGKGSMSSLFGKLSQCVRFSQRKQFSQPPANNGSEEPKAIDGDVEAQISLPSAFVVYHHDELQAADTQASEHDTSTIVQPPVMNTNTLTTDCNGTSFNNAQGSPTPSTSIFSSGSFPTAVSTLINALASGDPERIAAARANTVQASHGDAEDGTVSPARPCRCRAHQIYEELYTAPSRAKAQADQAAHEKWLAEVLAPVIGADSFPSPLLSSSSASSALSCASTSGSRYSTPDLSDDGSDGDSDSASVYSTDSAEAGRLYILSLLAMPPPPDAKPRRSVIYEAEPAAVLGPSASVSSELSVDDEAAYGVAY